MLYLIEDDEQHKAPQYILDATQAEIQFMRAYRNKTGIHWRHYYGKNGPRPPPVLYMWNASDVGAVHKVESDQGHW